MILDLPISLIAGVLYRKILRLEKEMGYRLILNPDPKNWINAAAVLDMTPVWYNYGLRARGINYATFGKIKNGLSTRFNPQSLYFQSWLGGYIVKLDNPQDWTIDDYFRLCGADQKGWLRVYGVKNPIVEINYKGIKNLAKIDIGKFLGTLYQGAVRSNTDVGDRINSLFQSLLWRTNICFFKHSNPSVKLDYLNFIPSWHESHPLLPYQVVDLEGYIVIIDIDPYIKAIYYANGLRMTDRKGKKFDTFKIIKDDLLKQIKAFKIEKV